MYEQSEKAIRRKSRSQAAMTEAVYLNLEKKELPTKNKIFIKT
jgi:hypothetical protein